MAQVVAGFTATPSSGCPPLLVSFTNTTTPSTGTTYQWNLDNGTGIITLTNPSTSYLTAGVYTVTLTATNGSSSNTVTHTITVYPAPTVSFNVSDTAVCPGVPVTFTSTTTSGAPGSLTYLWSFGDGYTATTGIATHAIGFPGYFNITLNATNSYGCSSSLTRNALVHIYTPPDPIFTASAAHICPNTDVHFTATPTGSGPFTYNWTFGDGSGSSSLPNPTHHYVLPGSYNARLIVTDTHGCEDSSTTNITVSNMTTSFTGPDSACRRSTVTFNNTSTHYSSDTWLFGNGLTSTAVNGTTAYTSPGTFTVSLITSDGYCIDTVTRNIYIPAPASSFTITPAQPCPPPVAATFFATLPAGASATWSYGDGTFGAGNPASHTYTDKGIDTVKMFETYGPGCRDTISTTYKINDLIFDEFNFSPSGGCIPLTVLFEATAKTTVPLASPLLPYPYPFTYVWNFGDGSPPDTGGFTAYHTFTAVGVYSVAITATSSNGCVVVRHDIMPAGVKPVDTNTVSVVRECYNVNKDGRGVMFVSHLISGQITGLRWIFGEGMWGAGEYDSTTRAVDTIYHVFALPGKFTDTLISYYNGCPDTFISKDTVIIDSPKSVPDLRTLCTPHNTIKATSFSIGADSVKWYFGDGTTSTLDTVVHTFPSSAIYNVNLTTYNRRSGCRDTAKSTTDLTRPTVSFHATDTAICRDQHTLDTAIVSSGFASAFRWRVFAAGDTFSYADSVTPHRVDTFHRVGQYSVQLIYFDQHECTDTLIRPRYILVAKPSDHFTVSPAVICWPAGASFTDVNSDQPGTFMTSYKWTWGDGSSGTTSSPGAAHTYSAPGTYTVTEVVTDNIGCKDTTVSNVSVYKTVDSFTSNISRACAHDNINFSNASSPPGSAYVWLFGDGAVSTLANPLHAYTDTGQYTVLLTMTEPHGCRDTSAETIRIKKPHAAFTMNDSIAVCPPLTVHFTGLSTGADSSVWNFGNGTFARITNPTANYTTPGYDTVMLIAIDSSLCKDTAWGHIQVYGYTGAFSYNPDTGCSPLRVVFRASLAGLANVSSITWDFADGSTAPALADTIVHVYTAGWRLPKLVLIDTSGCRAQSVGSDTIRIDSVIAGFRTIPRTICPYDSTKLTDTSLSYWSHIVAHSWAWQGRNDTTTSPYAGNLSQGVDTITLQSTDAWGCVGRIAETVTVNPLPDAGVITSDIVNAFCIGYKFTVSDTAAGGIWTFTNGHVLLSGDTITAISPGTDTLYYVVTNRCGADTAVDSFSVSPPVPRISGNAIVCVGDTIILSDSLFGGMWLGGGGNVSISANLHDSAFVVGRAAGTTLITYSMDLGCVTTTTVTINTLPVFTSSVSQIKCYADSNGSITITPDSTGAPYKYTWSDGSTTLSLSGLSAGTYSLTVQDTALGCRLASTFQITMPDSLGITDSIDNDICFSPNGSITATAFGGTQPYQYEWSTKAAGDRLTGLTAGQYVLTLTDLNGCIKNFHFILSDSACPYIVIHNAISPNGDGINETWVIEHIENFPKNVVQVFDKWGDEIFEQTNYKNDWYGLGKNGKEVPDGTYYYLIKLNSEYVTGQKNVFTGSLLIKR